jgi:hypothetical protein
MFVISNHFSLLIKSVNSTKKKFCPPAQRKEIKIWTGFKEPYSQHFILCVTDK